MSSPGGRSADEVNELLQTVTAWVQRAMPAPASGHGGPECQWCPLCQLASALRGEHPELTERLAEMGALVAGAVRSLLESTPGRPGPRPQQAGPAPDPIAERLAEPPPRPRPRVERIVLDDGTV